MMRGTNPIVGVGLAGLAGLALLFVASKAKAAAPATIATPGAATAPPGTQVPAAQRPPAEPIPPFVPGVGLPQPQQQQPTNTELLNTQLGNLLTQVATQPQSIDPGQFVTLEQAFRANNLPAQADAVHAAAVEFNRPRAG